MGPSRPSAGRRAVEHPAALPRHAERGAEQGRRRDGAHDDDHPRLYDLEFRRQPRAARDDLPAGRPLVDPALAPLLPLEVLHGIGDVGAVAVDPRPGEAVVEHPAGGADERVPGTVLTITGGLADQEQLRPDPTLTEDRLRGS